MVMMDRYYTQERLLDIWQNINKVHLSYLEMEESPEKINHRLILEDCIKEFLCIAAHSEKFDLRETADILQRSASNKKDFSGYKAAMGWNAIQLYAGNLLAQPWRKEYRQVKTYCGFYKHQIEANLVGAEIMFEAMGYKHFGNGVLVLEGPICPDRVTSVSRDCLVAYVECQIIKFIWEEVSPTFNITWLEILEFRKTHLSTPEQAIKALKYQFHQKQYQEQTRHYSQGSDPLLRCQNPMTSPVLPANHSFPTLIHSHNHIPPQSQYIYGSNGCCSNYSTYAHLPPHSYPYPVPVAVPQSLKSPQFNSNNYYCTNGYATPSQGHPVYGYGVPTAQLIELDAQNGASYDVIDKACHPRASKVAPNGIDDENWDYVYRNLESQGYSKDLGERGDILSLPNDKKKKKAAKATNLDEVTNNVSIVDVRPLKISEALDKLDRDKSKNCDVKQEAAKESRSSSYENLSNNASLHNNNNNNNNKINSKVAMISKNTNKTLPREKVTPESSFNAVKSRTLDVKKLSNSKLSKKVGEESNKWQCKACTYLNENNKDICEMCSKSRTAVEQRMEIGGAQCSKCTLVNPKDAKECQACDNSLKGSPTYI